MEQPKIDFEKKYYLDPDQVVVKEEILDRFIVNEEFTPIQLLPADTGYGKSRITAWVAKYLYENHGLKVFILCPATIIPMWQTLMNDAGVPIEFIGTFDKLAGRAQTGCKHKYLTREDGKTGPFHYSEAWRELVCDKGIFVISDESQAIKNRESARHWAFVELAKCATHIEGSLIRVLHLSASPIDKKENWESLFRNMGLMTHREIMGKGGTEYKKFGLGEVLENVSMIDPKVAGFVQARWSPLRKKMLPEIFSYLWKTAYQTRLVIPVTDPIYTCPNSGRVFKRIRANFFATLDEEGLKLADKGLAMLREARIIKNGEVDLNAANRQENFGIIQQALIVLCHAKVNTCARLALDKLREGKNVAICCPFLEDQNLLYKKLMMYSPALLNGATQNRQEVIANFNNDEHECRVIIMSPKVGGEGISLHDTTGRWPRCMFMIPNYEFTRIFQAAGRVYRRGMMSDTEAYVLYANNTASIEAILINSLSKTKVADSVLIPGSGRVFPGAYDFIIENEGPEHKEFRAKLDREQAIAKADMELLQQSIL